MKNYTKTARALKNISMHTHPKHKLLSKFRTVFNIDNNKKCLWFLKDHVTLNTWVMAVENLALASEE